MECTFNFIYYNNHKASSYVKFHSHNSFELVYYIKGRGYITIDGVRHSYVPGTFSLTYPDYSHDEMHYEDTEVLFIGFNYDVEPIKPKNGVFSDAPSKTILYFLEEMKKEIKLKEDFYTIRLELLVKEILIAFSRVTHKSMDKSDNLIYAIGFINENFKQKIDFKALAELSGYSYHRFRHLFKEKTGTSPINYVINRRIENARYLLASTNLTILAISQESGFSNEILFNSMFKRLFLQTPGAYRKKYKLLDDQHCNC